MISADSENPSLGEAATCFLAKLSPDERETRQQEVSRFVRWYGQEQSFTTLSAPAIANYAERLSFSDTDYTKKLELIRAFLTFVKKQGWSKINLATHLKTRKAKTSKQDSARHKQRETINLTKQGQAEMEAELVSLKDKRLEVIEDMRRAAADKDFRENAPLDAAKEQRGYVEGRIRELEETLKSASVINMERNSSLKAGIGSNIVLNDLSSGEELRYIIVNPREVDATKGKISSLSPIGKAIIGKSKGEKIEVTAPAGKLRYQITKVAR